MPITCAVVTLSAIIIYTDALTANICLTISLKSTPIVTDEIPRNLSDANTVTGVVGAIWITTTSYSTSENYSTATASVASVAFSASITTTPPPPPFT